MLKPLFFYNDRYLIFPLEIIAKSKLQAMRIKEMIANYRSSWLLRILSVSSIGIIQLCRAQHGEYSNWYLGVISVGLRCEVWSSYSNDNSCAQLQKSGCEVSPMSCTQVSPGLTMLTGLPDKFLTDYYLFIFYF